jgi:protoheme IX farnesyltransferase
MWALKVSCCSEFARSSISVPSNEISGRNHACSGHPSDNNALLLFLIVFVWTPPHFWSLAIARRDEYERAGIPMLPVTHGVEHTRLQVLLYTILLAVVTLLPYLTRMSGPVYLCGAIVLNTRFLYHAIRLKVSARQDLPLRVFKFSVSYLMLLFAALLIDHYLT